MSAPAYSANRAFFFVVLLAFTGPFAADLYIPALPSMATALHATASDMQLTLTLYFLGFSVSQLFFGPLSDRLGRKPVVLTGLLICCFGTILSVAIHNLDALLLGRLIQGIGMAATSALLRSIMVDTYSGKKLAQMNSYSGVIFSIAPGIAPILGGYLDVAFGWQSNFLFLMTFTLIAIGLVIRFFPETNLALNHEAMRWQQIKSNYHKIIVNKSFIGFAICSSLALSCLISYLSITPFMMEDLWHLSVIHYSWVTLSLTVAILFGRLLNAFILKKIDMNQSILLGIMIIVSFSIVLFAIALLHFHNLIVVILPIMMIIVGSSLVFPNASASAIGSFKIIAGSASAVFGFIQLLGTFIISAVIAYFQMTTLVAIGTLLVILSAAMIINYFILLSTARWKYLSFAYHQLK